MGLVREEIHCRFRRVGATAEMAASMATENMRILEMVIDVGLAQTEIQMLDTPR
jgi:hypothetical protein